MNIIEATKKSVELNKAIYRKSNPNIQFIPTNSLPLTIVTVNLKDERFGKMWNPTPTEILADDWEVLN
ncbi:DUF2829 domain-containing protein [Lactococcus lactis]|uniref:DUF2829 domain-containing protein n=1 Tax=Lactococcus lactis TaxID=1358 RepID=UPI00223AFB6B|nr:DUF2829 domain-containing protein [Lactococcus lactis]MCT1186317.1 DUF2829 domain-containing protein [Lactococcus lactis]MCT1189579.1 DUF2829 domain-containing protein [Lactococcus lactis]